MKCFKNDMALASSITIIILLMYKKNKQINIMKNILSYLPVDNEQENLLETAKYLRQNVVGV